MMSYSAYMSLWQEFHEHKSGNERKCPKCMADAKRDATVRCLKGECNGG